MVTGPSRRSVCLGIAASFQAAVPTLAVSAGGMRIAALEHRIVETVLALGVTPFAMQDPFNYRRWTVEPALPSGVHDLGTEPEPNAEYLAELRPDLILIPSERRDLVRLGAIAPLVRLRMTPAEGVSEYDHFAGLVVQAGDLLDRRRAARRVLADVEAAVARAAARLTAHRARELYIVTFVDERHVWVYGRANLFQNVLDRVGFINAWDRESVFDVVGIERLADRPRASLLYIENNMSGLPAGLSRSPLWRALPFVRDRRVHAIASVSPFGALPTAGRFSRLFADALGSRAAGHG
ncbi:ABC transporter substrate-binding protein [Pseudochelatococcus sp. B33]